jgi:hypothetical protein
MQARKIFGGRQNNFFSFDTKPIMCYQKIARLLSALDGTHAQVHPAIFIQQELHYLQDCKALEKISKRLSEVLDDMETCASSKYLRPRENVAVILQEELKSLPEEIQNKLIQTARVHLEDVRENLRALSAGEENEHQRSLSAKAQLIADALKE